MVVQGQGDGMLVPEWKRAEPELKFTRAQRKRPGLAAPSTGSVLSRTEKGGARWQFVYNEGALGRVSAELRYWPDRQTNPELIVPDAGGMKDGITQVDAKK